ncbi:MAG: group II intron maturase-specific domain-containing protein [Bryobacteraceae bacterium]
MDLKEEQAQVNFLGYTFRTEQDLFGRPKRFLNMVPSDKAMKKERASLHALTNSQQCFQPAPELIGGINPQLVGWKNYFSIGYQAAYWEIDWYVRERLIQQLQRRSRRGFSCPQGSNHFSVVPGTGTGRSEWLPSDTASSECLRRELFGRAGCGKPARPSGSESGR